jgi:hypothetical protein
MERDKMGKDVLKTFKDIPIELRRGEFYDVDKELDDIEKEAKNVIQYKEDVRKEAIKHVKDLKKVKNGFAIKWRPFDGAKIEWIMDFFNLTKEDLK